MIDLVLVKGNPMLFIDLAKGFIDEFMKSCNVTHHYQSPIPSKAYFNLDDLMINPHLYENNKNDEGVHYPNLTILM